MAREILPPEPGDEPGTKRYHLTHESVLSEDEIDKNVTAAKAQGRRISIEDVGERPLKESEITHNMHIADLAHAKHEVEMQAWDKTPEGHLYLTCQKLARQALRDHYENPDGSYCGSAKSRLGHTEWTISTGSGWGEFYLLWHTKSAMWRLTYAQNEWYLDCYASQDVEPQKLLGHDEAGKPIYQYNSKWKQTVQTHIPDPDMAKRFGRLTPILEKLQWTV